MLSERTAHAGSALLGPSSRRHTLPRPPQIPEVASSCAWARLHSCMPTSFHLIGHHAYLFVPRPLRLKVHRFGLHLAGPSCGARQRFRHPARLRRHRPNGLPGPPPHAHSLRPAIDVTPRLCEDKLALYRCLGWHPYNRRECLPLFLFSSSAKTVASYRQACPCVGVQRTKPTHINASRHTALKCFYSFLNTLRHAHTKVLVYASSCVTQTGVAHHAWPPVNHTGFKQF
jgi:hypothetical protein